MLNKRKRVVLMLLLIVIVLLDVFSLTPFARIFAYLAIVLSTVGHYFFLTRIKMFSILIKQWYFAGILLMLISMLTCYWHYGQSLISGFVANVKFYHVGSGILFLYLFRKYSIGLSDLFNGLTKAGWVMLALIGLMSVVNFAFINESEFTGQIVEVHAGKINKTLINFIAVFWFCKYLFENNYKYLFFSLLFFAGNHFHEIQRFNMLAILFVLGIGFLKGKNVRSKVKAIIPALFAIFFAWLLLFNTPAGLSVMGRFYEASKIITENNADNINDASTAVRIFERDFALERFKRHPIFGNGYFRASEKDKVIGRDIYFYPLDIGLYGILYSLGALGILIFIIQLRLVWTYYTKRSSHPFHFFVVLALLFFTFSSILNGNTINNFKAFFFFVCLLAISNSITAQPIVHVKRRNKKDIVKAEKSGSIVWKPNN